MRRHCAQRDLDLARFFLQQTGHKLEEWEECNHLWEYTAVCKDCGQRFGISVTTIQKDLEATAEKNEYELKMAHQLGIWHVRMYGRPPYLPGTNICLARFRVPREEPLSCKDGMIKDLIK